MIIQRKFQFDAAHMLSFYEGKCANLHGHTYTGEVRLEGVTGEDGMLVDYNDIKRVVDRYDHSVLFSEKAWRNEQEEALFEWVQKYSLRFKVIEGKCTAENIARDIAWSLKSLSQGIHAVKVWLHETPDSTAAYST